MPQTTLLLLIVSYSSLPNHNHLPNIRLFGDYLDVVELNDEQFEIYPNPARDFVKLSAISRQSSVVRIYNTLGMLVDEFEMNSDEIEINVSDYKSGVYFVEVSTINGSVIKKFIIE